jgi:beta-lactam-binding protein with PASTA domain
MLTIILAFFLTPAQKAFLRVAEAQVPAAVTLQPGTAPAAAEPGVTIVNVMGSGFPTGTIPAANVNVELAPAGSGPVMTAAVLSVVTVIGTTRRIAFQISPTNQVSLPTVYKVSVSGTTSTGVSFASSNTSAVTINPPATIALNPASGTQGQGLSVMITGSFSNFFQGSTVASFGPGISVGGAAPGAAGPVTVNNATSATAQLAISPGAKPGAQNVSVQTGAEIASLTGGFTIAATVPNVVGDTQAAATTAITGAGLVVGTVTSASSSTVPSGDVISQSPAAGTSVAPGSAVNLVISTGPPPVSVPNVVGDTQAAATTAITGAGLVVGTVTSASSSTVPSGDVISQSPAAGTSVNVGSAVDLVISSGPASNPAVAINLQLNQFIVTAGASITFTDVAVDAQGNPVSVTPTCGITADPTATGTAPTIASGTINTSSNTRGVYTLTCNLTSPALSASGVFTVLLPTDTTVTTTQQANFAGFSNTTTMSESLLLQIGSALTNGNTGAVNSALAQLQAGLTGTDFDALDRSMAFAPEGGFPASPGALPGFGINPTAADANVGPFVTNLTNALQNLTTFLQTTPLATMTQSQQSQYTSLQNTLSTLVSQIPSLNPSSYGITANASQIDFLFSDLLPQYYQALTQGTVSLLVANGFTASLSPRPHRKGLRAEADSPRLLNASWHPENARFMNASLPRGKAAQFFLIDLEVSSELQMDLINKIYGPFFAYIAKAAATMVLRDAFQAATGAINIDGLVSGASQSFFVFQSAPSEIDVLAADPILENNKVYLIGPDQINGAASAIDYLKNLRVPTDLNDLYNEIQGFVDLFKAFQCLYKEAVQPPDFALGGGNCLTDPGNDSCIALTYNNGLSSVYQPSGINIPAPVLIFEYVKTQGTWSIGEFSFVPLASANPCQ